MCLAVPLQIVEINGKDAIGEKDGVKISTYKFRKIREG